MADFDTLFSGIKNQLESYSDEQAEAYQFDVYADYFRTLPSNGHAAVFLYLGSMNPDEETGTLDHCEFESEYILELVCWGKKSSGSRADEAAGARLRYLIDQVLNALNDPENLNFGMSAGSFKRSGYPRIEPLDVPQQTEKVAAASRMTFPASTVWEPGEVNGTAIDSINVTADKWAALLEE